jgi:hypothetical protein
MKLFVIVSILLFPFHFIYGQVKRIKVSDKLELVQLSPQTYMHTDCGRIRIRNKEGDSSLPETDGYYKMLTIDFRDDAVGMTIILKEFIQ